MLPGWVDIVNIGDRPIDEILKRQKNTSFFLHFTLGRRLQIFMQGVSGARHTLPEPGMVSALNQQHIKSWRMNDDQNRLGDFEVFIHTLCFEKAALQFETMPPPVSASECAIP